MFNFIFNALIASTLTLNTSINISSNKEFSLKNSSALPHRIVGDIVNLNLEDNTNHVAMVYAIFKLRNLMHMAVVTMDDPEIKLYVLKINFDGSLECVGLVKDLDTIKKIIKSFSE